MRRHELSDAQWELVKPNIPAHEARTGRPRRDPRVMLNGMMWIVRTGAPWRDLPERYGPWQTVYDYFTDWRQSGVLDQILEALQIRLDAEGHIDWDLWCIDGSSVRASRAAAGASKKSCKRYPEEPQDHALGRSRGGFGSKLHLVTDGTGLPIAVEVSPGEAHESKHLESLMNLVRIPQEIGRPRTRPFALAGDKAYSSRRIREWLHEHKIQPVIPRKDNEYRDGRMKFDKKAYRKRSIIEQCIGWLKECRRICTRFDKLAISFLAMIKLAMIDRYMKMAFSDKA